MNNPKTEFENKEKSLRAVRNFCYNHTKDQMEDMLNIYYRKLSADDPESDPWEKHRVLDFFESLEELLPAVFELERIRQRECILAEKN